MLPFGVGSKSLSAPTDADTDADAGAGAGTSSGLGFDFAAREEELRRLDEELNAQRSQFAKKAESLTKQQNERFNRAGASFVAATTAASALDDADAAAGGADDTRFEFEVPITTSAPFAPAAAVAAAKPKPAASATAAARKPGDRKSVSAVSRPVGVSGPAAATGKAASRPGSARHSVAPAAAASVAAATSDMDISATAAAQLAAASLAESGMTSGGGGDGGAGDGGDAEDAELNAVSAISRLRFYRTRINVLQSGLEKLAAESREKDTKATQQQQTMNRMLEDRRKYQKMCQSYEAEIERQKKLVADQTTRTATLEREIAAVRKDAQNASSTKKTLETANRDRDVKLQRALADAEKYRNQLSEWKAAAAGSKKTADGAGGEVTRLRAEVKKLTTQKTELLSAFKKQLKLIDILKRQKLHIEAAKLLSFSEDEFTKTLELGGDATAAAPAN